MNKNNTSNYSILIKTINKKNNEYDNDDKYRKKTAITNGLKETASWNDIINYNSEVQRKEFIQRFELKKNTNWKKISNYYCDKDRINEVRKNNLSLYANWREINNLLYKSTTYKSR